MNKTQVITQNSRFMASREFSLRKETGTAVRLHCLLNPNAEETSVVLEGSWNAVFGGEGKALSGPQKLAGKGVILLEKAN